MKRALLLSRLPTFALAVGYLAAAAPAAAQATPSQATGQTPSAAAEEPANRRTVSFIDLNAGAGYSSNPLLGFSSRSSAFGRLSVYGFKGWNNERGSTYLSGYVEDTTYLRGAYGSKQIFRVGGHTDRAVSEKLRVFGDLSFSGDIAGQLLNRFTPAPVVIPPVTNPPPETNPELLNFSGRQYRINGQVGAAIITSARSSVSLSAGAMRGIFTGGNSDFNYTTYNAGVGYNHQLSERTWVGANVNVQHQDYKGDDYANVVNTVATIRTQLAENINANAQVGVLAIYSHRNGENSHAYSPSFAGSICKSGERSSFCARLTRDASTPLGIGTAQTARSASITTSFDLNYNRRVGPTDTIQANLIATRSSTADRLQNGRFSSTYATALGTYDRKIGKRLFAGVSVGVRELFQNGPDPKTDLNGNFYLRYRIGDLL